MDSEMLGALIGLGRAVEGNTVKPDSTTHVTLLKGCIMYLQESNYSVQEMSLHIDLLHREKYRLVERCLSCSKQCGRNDDYNLEQFMEMEPDELEKRRLLISQIISLGSTEYYKLEYEPYDKNILQFIYDGLFAVGSNNLELIEHTLIKGNKLFKCN